MPRRPVHEKPKGRREIWTAIRAAEPFTIRDITDAVKVHPKTVRDYVVALVAAGIVAEDGVEARPRGQKDAHRYRLVRNPGAEAPRIRSDGTELPQGSAQEQMWRTMKVVVSFTPGSLALAASTEEIEVKEAAVVDYARWLHRAGLLSKRGETYTFLRHKDVGPKPPMIQRIKQVYDPNSGTVIFRPGNRS